MGLEQSTQRGPASPTTTNQSMKHENNSREHLQTALYHNVTVQTATNHAGPQSKSYLYRHK